MHKIDKLLLFTPPHTPQLITDRKLTKLKEDRVMKKQITVLIMCGLFFGYEAQAMYSSWRSGLNNAAAYLASMRAAAARTASEAWQPFARQYSSWFAAPRSLSTNPYPTLRAPSPYGSTNMMQFTAPRLANLNMQTPYIANTRPLSTSIPTNSWWKELWLGKQENPTETVVTEASIPETISSVRHLTASEIKAQARLQELKQPTTPQEKKKSIYQRLRETAEQIDHQADRTAIKTAMQKLTDADSELTKAIIDDTIEAEEPHLRIYMLLQTINSVKRAYDGFDLLSENARKEIERALVNYLKDRTILTNMDFVRFALGYADRIAISATILFPNRDDTAMSNPSDKRLYGLISIIGEAVEQNRATGSYNSDIRNAHDNLNNQQLVEKAAQEILMEHHIPKDAIDALLHNQPIPSYGGELTPEEEQAGKDYVRKILEASRSKF